MTFFLGFSVIILDTEQKQFQSQMNTRAPKYYIRS